MFIRKKTKVGFLKKSEKGFTLIELMVVIVIMTIVYAISMSNYSKMGKKTDLENTVYSMALFIRETQYYGINKKLKSATFTDDDQYPFGIHLDDANRDRFIAFTDLKGGNDDKFDGNCNVIQDNSECRKRVLLPKVRGVKIISVQYWNNSGGWGSSVSNFGKVNIMFKRPDPDAKIIHEEGEKIESKIKICLTDKSETYFGSIIVGAAGDISVSKKCD